MDAKNLDEDIPELEEEKVQINNQHDQFANKLISINELEKNSGTFQIPEDYLDFKNITLLSCSVKPYDQVIEKDEEWNYDVLHYEIGQIVRSQYGEYYEK